MGDGFTSQKIQPTVSKYWRKLQKTNQTTETTQNRHA